MNRKTICYISLFTFFALLGCKKKPVNGVEEVTTNQPSKVSTETQKPEKKYAFSQITVGFYNVENLFDTKDNPAINDDEFLPQGKNKWTQKRYQKKLEKLAQAIKSLGDQDGAEILGLAEVENRNVIKDLINTKGLKNKNYKIIHFDSPDKRGIDVAMIYKASAFKPILKKNIPVTFANKPHFKTRDILLVSGKLNNEAVHFIWTHFPSRRGGAEKSEPYRKAVAKQIRVVINELLREQPQAKILVAGDFNDLPENASIKEVLKAKPNPDYSKKELFNPAHELMTNGKGSYNYKGKWQMLDQILLSESWIKAKVGFKYVGRSMNVYAPEFMKQQQNNKYKGNPDRTYAGNNYLGGMSDHFPVYAQFKLLKKENQ